MTSRRTRGRVALLPLLAPALLFLLTSCGGTTSGDPVPVVRTLVATGVGTSAATLTGSVNPNGLATDAWFEWGTSPGLATFERTSSQAMGAGTSPLTVKAALSGLTPGTTFYYRVAASSAAGAAYGAIATFRTVPALAFAVVSTTPANDATGVPPGDPVTVTFNEDVEPATLVGAVTVSSLAGILPGVTSYSATTRTAIFTPDGPLEPLTDYAVTVEAKVKSVSTERLTAPYTFTFRSGTEAPP